MSIGGSNLAQEMFEVLHDFKDVVTFKLSGGWSWQRTNRTVDEIVVGKCGESRSTLCCSRVKSWKASLFTGDFGHSQAEDEFVISYADVVSIDQFESAVTFDLLSINLDSVCAAPVVDEIASIFAFQQRMMS